MKQGLELVINVYQLEEVLYGVAIQAGSVSWGHRRTGAIGELRMQLCKVADLPALQGV